MSMDGIPHPINTTTRPVATKAPNKSVTDKLHQTNSVYDLPSIEQAIKWMHAVCGYLVKINLD
jgi:hypothetical protein